MGFNDSYNQLKSKFTDNIQDKYETIRPILLFNNIPIKERARQVGCSKNTIKDRIDKFQQHGMKGLFDLEDFPKKVKNWDIPQEVIDEILSLISIYSNFKYTEICNIVYHKFGYTLNRYQVKIIITENPHSVQQKLPLIPSDTYQLKIELIKHYYTGWSPTALAEYFRLSRQYVYKIINTFENEHFAGLIPKSKAPKHHYRTTFFPIIYRIYVIQKENSLLGKFRVWGLLRKQLKKDNNTIEISIATVAHIMAINRSLYQELSENNINPKEKEDKVMPFKFKYQHQFWFIDIRYFANITGKWIYSICIIDGYSRSILFGDISESQDLLAILMILYNAILRYGVPTNIVSDNAAVFISLKLNKIFHQLGIIHKTITVGKPWENLIESFFGVQARMTDYHTKNANTFEEIKFIHDNFIDDYNTTDNWALQKRKDGITVPLEILSWVKGRLISEDELHRKLYAYMSQRVTDKKGYIQLHNFYFYVEECLPKRLVRIWIYLGKLQIEYNNELLIEYKCNYDENNNIVNELNNPLRYVHKYTFIQLKLFEITPILIQKIERKPYMKSNKKSEQLHLFKTIAA